MTIEERLDRLERLVGHLGETVVDQACEIEHLQSGPSWAVSAGVAKSLGVPGGRYVLASL
jgi:hypothetical protein